MGWQLFRDRTQGAVSRADDPARTYDDPDAAFWASPVGRATRARMRGDRFFQIELDDATLTAFAEAGAAESGGRRARRTGDLLGQIEELGWRLEHVTWWRGDFDVPVALAAPGPVSSTEGHVKGVYLFHAVPEVVEDVAPTAGPAIDVSHPPSHRRDVL